MNMDFFEGVIVGGILGVLTTGILFLAITY